MFANSPARSSSENRVEQVGTRCRTCSRRALPAAPPSNHFVWRILPFSAYLFPYISIVHLVKHTYTCVHLPETFELQASTTVPLFPPNSCFLQRLRKSPDFVFKTILFLRRTTVIRYFPGHACPLRFVYSVGSRRKLNVFVTLTLRPNRSVGHIGPLTCRNVRYVHNTCNLKHWIKK